MKTPYDPDDDPDDDPDEADDGGALEYATRVAADRSLGVEPLFMAISDFATTRSWASKKKFEAAVERHFPGGEAPAPTEPFGQARECLARYSRALEAEEEAAASAFVDEAFELDPRNPDVLWLRAERDLAPSAQLGLVEDAIAEALARAGGAPAASACLGRMWEAPALRPYLRARGRKVELLIELGRDAEALAEGEVLLDLDRTDALTIRYRLVGSRLLLNDPAGYRRLRSHFPDDPSYVFLWGDVLAALLADDGDAASSALAWARRGGAEVGKYLLEPWELHSDLPDRCAAGTADELSVVAQWQYPAWCASPSALAWLRTDARQGVARSAKMRKLLATLRPPGDDGPEPRWLEWVVMGGREVPEGLVRAIRTDGERGVAWLCALLRREDLEDGRTPGGGAGPAAAAVLLGMLAAPSALPAQLEVLGDASLDSLVSIYLVPSFRGFGARALEPLLALLAKQRVGHDGDPTRHDAILMALVSLEIPDARIYRAVEAIFPRKPEMGASSFASLGMPHALPLLASWLDAQRVGLANDLPTYAENFETIVGAITELGGVLTAEQERKRSRLRAILASAEQDDDSTDDDEDGPWATSGVPDDEEFLAALDDMFAPDRPKRRGASRPDELPPLLPLPPLPPLLPLKGGAIGRNVPCPCGSGRKYKKCCWAKDHGEA